MKVPVLEVLEYHVKVLRVLIGGPQLDNVGVVLRRHRPWLGWWAVVHMSRAYCT